MGYTAAAPLWLARLVMDEMPAWGVDADDMIDWIALEPSIGAVGTKLAAPCPPPHAVNEIIAQTIPMALRP